MSISLRAADERRALCDRYRDVLLAAAKQRDKRRAIITTEYGLECEWALFEQETLLRAVNRERYARRLPPASPEQIRNADSQAAGHIDYAVKVALYCAEIAMGIERTVY